MAKHPKPEEIVAKLRQADVLISQGQSVADAIRALGVSSVTYYRWRREFGGLKSDQVRRMKSLETENSRLRKAIADLTLDRPRGRRAQQSAGSADKVATLTLWAPVAAGADEGARGSILGKPAGRIDAGHPFDVNA